MRKPKRKIQAAILSTLSASVRTGINAVLTPEDCAELIAMSRGDKKRPQWATDIMDEVECSAQEVFEAAELLLKGIR